MIVWAEEQYPIGKKFDSGASGIIDMELTKHYMPFFVVRGATLDEWIAGYIADGGDKPEDARRYFQRRSDVYFYKISVD